MAKGRLVEERAKRTLIREEVDLASDSGSGTSLIGAAGAPMGNLAHRCVTYEVCSSIVLVTSGAVTVVTTATGAVPLEQCPCSSVVLVTSRAVTVVPAVPGAVPLEISPSFSEIDG